MKKQKNNEDVKSYSSSDKIPDKKGNGILTNNVTFDSHGEVISYSMAYINHSICAKDNGRVIGYDNKHGKHHRHIMGQYELVKFISYTNTVETFQREWNEFREKYNEQK